MQELRDRINLSEVVGRSVKLTRAGREFKGCCPFHNEKSPSFYVNDDKQFYHCFGCGAHGDVIGFIMQNGNLSFIEAVESLATQAGMQVPEQTPQEIARSKTEKSLYNLLDDTARWFEARLRDNAHRDALTYVRERGMSEEMLAAFRVGFSPADSQALPRYLKAQGYSNAQMIEAGVARASTRGGEPYSFFRDRVMFPVPDRRGRIVAFGGRVLPEHLRPVAEGDSKPPKYINSSETVLFHKGEMLYGEPHARQAAADGQTLIVVEGYLDVIASFSAGYRGALAPLGTALTEEQILALWKMIPADQKIPVLCFDGDDAGRRAAARSLERILPLLKPDHSVRFAFLPNGEDPDSLIKGQGKAAFDAVINSAMNLVDFLWTHHTMGRTFDTPEERAGLSKALDDDALRIPDQSVQHYYRDALRQKVRTSFRTPFNPGPRGGSGKWQGKPNVVPTGVTLRRPAFSESRIPLQILLACILNHPALFRDIEDEFGRVNFPDDRMGALRQCILMVLGADEEGLDSKGLAAYLMQQGFETELKMVLSDAIYVHAGFARPNSELDVVRKGWQDTVSLIRRKSVGRELQAAAQTLAGEFSDENEQRMMALHRSNRSDET
ncbi:MAG: dnaG [Micavibrio sp.]|nr:dnaG [Micavibrio sp.]